MTKRFNRSITRRFSSARSKIRKGMVEEAIELLNNLQKDIVEDRCKLLNIIEVGNKVALSVNKRYLEIVDAEGSYSKLTLNPVSGRTTLKICKKSSDNVKDHLLVLTKKIMKDGNLPPMTLRGKFNYHENEYKILMQSESKRFTFNYALKDMK